jgi:iodotyrosine deiodinase
MGIDWVEDLKPIGTDWQKPYLTDCGALVVFMEELYSFEESGVRRTNHYHEISAAMSAGMFVAALHHAGLCTVTTTPLNATKKIREVLGRPDNEKVLLLWPIGFPADDATMPNLKRKDVAEIMITI